MQGDEAILYLYKEDELLAVLRNVRGWDFPWYICDFQPTAAFESYKPLFDHEIELLDTEGATDAWNSAYEEIEALKLKLLDPNEVKTTTLFILHIEGGQARFRAVFK